MGRVNVAPWLTFYSMGLEERQRPAIGIFGNLQSAGCLGTREAVIAAHDQCVNGLIVDICKHQGKRCTLQFISEDRDKSLKSLWADTALQSLCSQDELWVAAVDRERKQNQERQEKGEGAMSEEEMERKSA